MVGMEPLKPVVNFMESARMTGFMPADRIPLIAKARPVPRKKAPTVEIPLFDVEMSENVEDEDYEEEAPSQKGKEVVRKPAAVSARVSANRETEVDAVEVGLKRGHQSSLSEGPAKRTRKAAKGAPGDQGDLVGPGLKLGDVMVPEDSLVDAKMVPAVRDAVSTRESFLEIEN
jgi:hypothetical protein